MSTTEVTVAPSRRFDSEGRLIPLTPEERIQHAAAIEAAVAALRAIPDDPNEDDREFFRAFDENHPDRPSLTGLY